MNEHEIGMAAPLIRGLDRQCSHWKAVCADLMIEVQELKAEIAALKLAAKKNASPQEVE